MGIEHNGEKLIRHLMPDFIERRDRRRMTTRVVEGEEHILFLKWKLREEAEEVASADAKTFSEEIADVRQALKDLCTIAEIKPAELDVPAVLEAPAEKAARIAFFRGQIDRLVALASSVPDEDVDLRSYLGDMVGVIATITEAAGIRDAVRAAMEKKLAERGGFNPGVVWKVWQENG